MESTPAGGMVRLVAAGVAIAHPDDLCQPLNLEGNERVGSSMDILLTVIFYPFSIAFTKLSTSSISWSNMFCCS
jgi:hypothetical protein